MMSYMQHEREGGCRRGDRQGKGEVGKDIIVHCTMYAYQQTVRVD